MRYNEILNEMLVRTNNHLTTSNIILAHGANIWIFDINEVIPKDTIKEITKETGLSKFTNTHQLIEKAEDRPDLLTAYYNNGVLYVDGMKASHHATSSVLLKKLADFLHVDSVNQTNYDYEGNKIGTEYSLPEMIGDIPNIAYHGTSLKFIAEILKTGIRPSDNSNWKNVGKFHDFIFLTADINIARFHANNTISKYNEPGVIIAAKIPDRNKIAIDYDVAYKFYGAKNVHDSYLPSLDKDILPYQNKQIKKIQKHNPKTNFTKVAGIFAYMGAISKNIYKFFR